MKRYLLIGILKLVSVLPWRWIQGLGGLAGKLLVTIPNRQRRDALINIRLCLPDLDAAQQIALRRRTILHFGRTYVELIRNLPPLVLIYIFYFFVVDQIMPLLGIEAFIRSRPENVKAVLAVLFAQESLFVQFVSGVFTIAFFEGAYITEIVRAGIESVERGQSEAAYSLGLSWFDKMRFIILPQAIRRVLPPLANEFINTIKYSSLASVVSIQELTYMGKQVQVATRFIFEPWITVAVMYLILTLSLSLGVGRLEKRMSRSD